MRQEVHFKDSMFIKDLTRRRLWCQWRHIITHRNQGFDKVPSVVSMTSYYNTQKSRIVCLSRIWHSDVCGVNHVILLHTEINDNMLASRLLLHNIYYRCKDQGENLQIIVKFSYLAKYDINIASYQSRNRFSFLCLYRVVIIWIISKIL